MPQNYSDLASRYEQRTRAEGSNAELVGLAGAVAAASPVRTQPVRRRGGSLHLELAHGLEGALHAKGAAVDHMGVDHGCAYVTVSEQFLNRSDVVARHE